tara:strand:- start:136 stop:387 length:252 start_codon:yes stop_codon:yes gene_type:complete
MLREVEEDWPLEVAGRALWFDQRLEESKLYWTETKWLFDKYRVTQSLLDALYFLQRSGWELAGRIGEVIDLLPQRKHQQCLRL